MGGERVDPRSLDDPAHGHRLVRAVRAWQEAGAAAVVEGEPVVVLETEKTQTEIEAPAAGTLRIAIPAGDDVIPVDAVLGHVE